MLHLKQVGELLSHIDPNLTNLAMQSKPENLNSIATPKKRKSISMEEDIHVPKKKNARSHERNSDGQPTLSHREEKAIQNLGKQVEENGGKSSALHTMETYTVYP